MKELGVPDEYRAVVHRLYDKGRATIRTSDGMFECFGSDIGVKQGCPLSPTLLGLYIDKMENWLENTEGEGVQLAGYVVKLLLYADDLILIAKTTQGLRDHLGALENYLPRSWDASNLQNQSHDFLFKEKKREYYIPFQRQPIGNRERFTSTLGLTFIINSVGRHVERKGFKGVGKLHFCFRIDAGQRNYGIGKLRRLFGLLVTPVVLYGCEVWGAAYQIVDGGK